jgi:hypothetical protein
LTNEAAKQDRLIREVEDMVAPNQANQKQVEEEHVTQERAKALAQLESAEPLAPEIQDKSIQTRYMNAPLDEEPWQQRWGEAWEAAKQAHSRGNIVQDAPATEGEQPPKEVPLRVITHFEFQSLMEGMPAWPDGENSPDSDINANQELTHDEAAADDTANKLFSLWKDYEKRAPDKARTRLSRASGIGKVKGLSAQNRDQTVEEIIFKAH